MEFSDIAVCDILAANFPALPKLFVFLSSKYLRVDIKSMI